VTPALISEALTSTTTTGRHAVKDSTQHLNALSSHITCQCTEQQVICDERAFTSCVVSFTVCLLVVVVEVNASLTSAGDVKGIDTDA
jgi:hypothetical protein